MSIEVQSVAGRPVAAVRLHLRQAEIASAFRDALEEVWGFLRSHPELHAGGPKVFIYSNMQGADGMDVDFGVEVTRSFQGAGNVQCVMLPSGRAATVLHVGPYDRLVETHAAVQRWCIANGYELAGTAWEVYGDRNDDPTKLETRVYYLLG